MVDSAQVLHLAERNEFTLGRAIEGQPILPDVDLSPFDAFTLGVSRLHAALRIINGEVVVADLGSSNGTRVNGQKIVPHVDYPINHGDVIALGKLKIQVLIIK
jgi:pSer/pThr/pTyr-binding forkhead associated (FHA) protein